MSPDAIVMMLVSMLIIWGGLVVALVRLRNAPDADALDRDL